MSQGRSTAGASYFDVAAALAEDTLMPARLLQGAQGVAQALDPTTPSADLQPGALLDLPLWCLSPLLQQKAAEARNPIFYSQKLQKKLKAGAACEDLRVRCAYFYDVGCILHSCKRSTPELANLLSTTFATRYQEMLVKALMGDPSREMTQLQCKLSTEEAALFEGGRASVAEFQRWRGSRGMPVAQYASHKRPRLSAADRPPLASIAVGNTMR